MGVWTAGLKTTAKRMLRHTPYRVVRANDRNRFDAIPEAIAQLKRMGFEPRHVIDGGANVGNFARLAMRLFPAARVHLVEPQPACREALERMAWLENFSYHPVALGDSSGTWVELAIDPVGVTTGAHVLSGPAKDSLRRDTTVRVPVASLDSLFADKLAPDDRAFLKLDLQGWELEALKGAERVLALVEVIIVEVSFFTAGEDPLILAIVQHLGERGFDLFDVAAMSARARDNRARQADFIFARRSSPLLGDVSWA